MIQISQIVPRIRGDLPADTIVDVITEVGFVCYSTEILGTGIPIPVIFAKPNSGR